MSVVLYMLINMILIEQGLRLTAEKLSRMISLRANCFFIDESFVHLSGRDIKYLFV